jgi:imidazolonepropionase-like amidohydrolase
MQCHRPKLSQLFSISPTSMQLAITALSLLCLMPAASAQPDTVALTDLHLIDGTGQQPVTDATVIVRGGRIIAAGPSDGIPIPADADIRSLAGKTMIPGLINSHGHAGGVRGLETGHYSTDNLLRQLRLYASYGVTTVVSLGDDEAAGFALRDSQNTASLDRSRLFVAGPVLNASTPERAHELVDQTAALRPDFLKIRVDDNLGRTPKMAPDVYRAFIQRAQHHNIPIAVHTYYLEDTRDVIAAGGDFVAHSVRDRHIDDAFAQLLTDSEVCYTPTLTRELSTYVYEDEPAFFNDAFFLAGLDQPEILDTLRDPQRQQSTRNNAAAQQYKASLPIAMANLKMLADAGVTIAMGTDSGPPARFQGYFEHLEMSMMQDAGLTPAQILHAATGAAASCMGLTDIGTLQPGNWADFIILSQDPLQDINHTRSIEEVWIAGKAVPRPGF